MGKQLISKFTAILLAAAMTLGLTAANAPAAVYAEEEESGKYVQDVFIAYDKTEKKAVERLKKAGWEPVEGDFNAGKASWYDNNDLAKDNVAAVMGIRRTNDKKDAITDMAVMNMKGGYSIPEYEKLINEKKTEIKELINNFKVVIEEYRANRKKTDNSYGKERADLSHMMLNKFYDGDPDDPVAVHDTGLHLGDLFDEKSMQEGNENGVDLEQILLESSGPAILVMETYLAFGADDGEETWLERASKLTGDELSENLPKYAPEAEGRDVTASEAVQYLNENYGDAASDLADQWDSIHDEMLWFEDYSEENDLWPHDDEDNDAYLERLNSFFESLYNEEKGTGEADLNKFMSTMAVYYNLYEIPYEGDWGESLGDFFNPADDEWYNPEPDYFLPLAAGLSEGQRASMDFLSLHSLLMIGFGNMDALKYALPDIKELFGDKTEFSIYTGVNREAFRTGVAITNEALMEQNAGKGQAFDKIWDNSGIVAITSYVAAAVGAVTMVSGVVMYFKLTSEYVDNPIGVQYFRDAIDSAKEMMKSSDPWMKNAGAADLKAAQEGLENCYHRTAGRWMMGVGGAILVAAAIVKGIQMWKYYDRDMKPIPRMIVDESDIVTYLTDDNGEPILDEKGNQKKTIDFKTYEYYTAVKCNRPEVGEIGDWNDGVSDYKDQDHYCYDIADLNADMGQEWIALYTVKSQDKGDPILADSLKVQYGKNAPEGYKTGLHLFTYTNVVDLGDTAWSYNNKKGGVRLYWKADEGAFAGNAASTFGTGQLALAGIGGLIIGILGSSLVLLPRRRKEKTAENKAETTT